MSRSDLETAQALLRKRQFGRVIEILEPAGEKYHDIFEYYFVLGTACLYVGDAGNAREYYERARRIKMTDSSLMLGQAALFLRRGDTDRAVSYYIEILDKDPLNKIARDALEFIRTQGTFETICKWADSGKLEAFYPPLGFNPARIAKLIFSAAAGVLIALFVLKFAGRVMDAPDVVEGPRADLSSIVLADSDSKISEGDAEDAFERAVKYFQDYRDNACQVEINRILASSADEKIKNKAIRLSELLDDANISFTNLPDNYDFATVAASPEMYKGCYVSWSGRYLNPAYDQEKNFLCDFLAGYEDTEHFDGVIPLKFKGSPELDIDRPLVVLGKLDFSGSKMFMNVKSYHQPLRNQQKK